MANTRWDTNAYRKRIASLNRVELHQLYPSESWSLYRAIQESKTVLDLGCGNGAKSSVISKISSHVSYTGVDLADSVIQDSDSCFHLLISFHQIYSIFCKIILIIMML